MSQLPKTRTTSAQAIVLEPGTFRQTASVSRRVGTGPNLGRRGKKFGKRRRGLSLLEVILSVAILGGAMVVIGHLYNLGYRSALQARFRSDANILVDAKMAELAAGVLPVESTGDAPIDTAPGWTYSVNIEDSNQPGLFMATVTVKTENPNRILEGGLSIARFIVDPDYVPEEDEE